MGLPHELWGMILEYLPMQDLMNFSLVSKFARSLAKLPLPWHNVNLYNVADIQPFVMECLRTNARHIRVLRAMGSKTFLGTNLGWSIILPKMSNVAYLDLSGNNCIEDVNFLAFMPCLQFLMLDDMRTLKRDNFVAFNNWPKNLKFFSFVRNYQCTEKELVAASREMPHARAIDIQYSGYLSPKEATEMCLNSPNLTGFFFTNYFYANDRKDWQEFAKRFHHVRFSCSFMTQLRYYANYPESPRIANWQA